ncbi:hypothetical protein C8R43DRAFT_1047694 [Mycena crocata]|nr:hypothetical protein C8R43DRAFT_1047694 [Mycena crocata]
MIPLGDIDLRREIRLDSKYGTVGRQRGRGSACRMYSAKLDGRRSDMTVILYRGTNAEENWREDISKHSYLRHPNVLQIYGAARSCELIPLDHYLELNRHSHLLTVYTWILCYREWKETWEYLNSVPLRPLARPQPNPSALWRCSHMDWHVAKDYMNFEFYRSLYSQDCIFLIRRSSGGFCADLTKASEVYTPDLTADKNPLERESPNTSVFLDRTPSDAAMIRSFTLEQYHFVCSWYLTHRFRSIPINSHQTVKLASVICQPASTPERLVEIVFLPESNVERAWKSSTSEEVVAEITIDGWIRYNAGDVLGQTFAHQQRISRDGRQLWLSQANHIFSSLQITSRHQDYALVSTIEFEIKILATRQTPPNNRYLFICPSNDFQIGPCSFRWPHRAAYWSLDSSGVEPLSPEQADKLGLPPIQLNTTVNGIFWDSSVYAGLRQFHEGKGFDPYSQNVAQRLGYPLYELASEQYIPFADVCTFESEGNPDRNRLEAFRGEALKEINCDECEGFLDDIGLVPPTNIWDFLKSGLFLVLGLCFLSDYLYYHAA